MRDLGRHLRLLKTLDNKVCTVCGWDETQHLIWFPHHNKIQHYILRHGKNSREFQKALKLIEKSMPVCLHCKANKYYSFITGQESGMPWPTQSLDL